jgi:hypothetical protein
MNSNPNDIQNIFIPLHTSSMTGHEIEELKTLTITRKFATGLSAEKPKR